MAGLAVDRIQISGEAGRDLALGLLERAEGRRLRLALGCILALGRILALGLKSAAHEAGGCGHVFQLGELFHGFRHVYSCMGCKVLGVRTHSRVTLYKVDIA